MSLRLTGVVCRPDLAARDPFGSRPAVDRLRDPPSALRPSPGVQAF